jgi:hypothetical protein
VSENYSYCLAVLFDVINGTVVCDVLGIIVVVILYDVLLCVV